MKQRSIDIAFDLDLRLTLGSGRVDPTGKQAWWATRTPNGPATASSNTAVHDRSTAWGDGADWILDRIPALLGIDDRPEELVPAHPLLRDLQKRHRGLRIGRTERVFESIVPAILGQKVATKEARRNQRALTRNHSEPAPGPLDLRLAGRP